MSRRLRSRWCGGRQGRTRIEIPRTRGLEVVVFVGVSVASSLRPNARPLPVELVQTGHLGEGRSGPGSVTLAP